MFWKLDFFLLLSLSSLSLCDQSDIRFPYTMTERIDAVIDYTPIHVKTNTKLTNFIK